MQQCTQAAFQAARAYIFTYGRPVDQHLFAYHFEGGSAQAVLAALAAYQNEDGGFGHGLEPDLRTAASSAIATQEAFNILRAIRADSTEPLVQRAVHYLLNTLDHERLRWPIVPAAVEDAPHATWWSYANSEQTFGGFLANPRAALVGFLHEHQTLVPAELLSRLRTSVIAHLHTLPAALDMGDFFCCLTLATSLNVPDADKAVVVDHLQRAVPLVVATEPAQWGAYQLTPLDIAPAPDALLAAVVDDSSIAANLDWLIGRQQPDGSWPLTWSWEVVDAAAWSQAERDWKGHITVARLKTLQAYGRIL